MQYSIEPLETRIAPAAVFTFVEADGDIISIKTSKGTDFQLAAVIKLSGPVGEQTLDLIDFSTDPITFHKTDVTITVVTANGNGQAEVGRINALRPGIGLDEWISLGKVTVQGNLAEIDAGDGNPKTPGIKALRVTSMDSTGIDLERTLGNKTSSVTSAASFIVDQELRGTRLDVGSVGKLTIGTVVDTSVTVGWTFGDYLKAKSGTITFGSVVGGSDEFSSRVFIRTETASLTIGSIIGGSGEYSANVNTYAKIGKLTVAGAIEGGSGMRSGYLDLGGPVTKLTLGPVHGGASAFSDPEVPGVFGQVRALDVKTLVINGTVSGGTGDYGGTLVFGNVGTATIKDVESGGALVFQKVGKFTSVGSIAGSPSDRALIASVDGFGSITAKGDVSNADIIAGAGFYTYKMRVYTDDGYEDSYVTETQILNPDTQIGAVTVKGNWTASNLVAGIVAQAGSVLGDFGNADDALPSLLLPDGIYIRDMALIPTTIKSITIFGAIAGTDGGTDAFGFVAQQIGSFVHKQPGAQKVGLAKGAHNDLGGTLIGTTNDVFIREMPGT